MIKWTGKSVNGTEWQAEADSFIDLYNQLCDMDVISTYDYNPCDKAKCEKAGKDFDELLNSDTDWETIQAEIDALPELTDKEMWLLIAGENGNAYYQNFYRWDDDKEIWIDVEEDVEWFDKNGKMVF